MKEEKSKLPKKQDSSAETPKPEAVKIPEYTLVDVIREIKTLQNEFATMSEAVKALGADVIKTSEETAAAFTDFTVQIQQLQKAFIKTVADVSPKTQSSHNVATNHTMGVMGKSSVYNKHPHDHRQFEPADLMQHAGWKRGKRKPDGTYDRGSLSYGWDFKNQFKPETVQELKIQGTIAIDKYEISLNGNFVSTKKA